MRKPLSILLAVTVLGVLAATVLWIVHQRLLDGRQNRIAELQTRLDELRATERLDLRQACLVAEHHLLSRPGNRALRVTCDGSRLDDTGPDVAKLSGLVYATSTDHVLFGGGFLGTLCLARTADGWAVVGDAFRMNECRFTVPENMGADQVAASVAGALADERRAAAERAIELVRQALAGAGAVPGFCAGLEAVTLRQLGMVDTDLLGKAPTERQRVGWGHLTSGAIQACLAVGAHAGRPQDCRLDEPWRYVLAFDRPDKRPPISSSAGTFTDGTFRATLRLVDMRAGGVICARPVAFQLDDRVLETTTRNIRDIYRDGVRESVCREVQALGQGMLALGPTWQCD